MPGQARYSSVSCVSPGSPFRGAHRARNQEGSQPRGCLPTLQINIQAEPLSTPVPQQVPPWMATHEGLCRAQSSTLDTTQT